VKIHIATASAEELRWAAECGLADGALVSSSMLERSFGVADLRTRALDFTRIVDGPVYVSRGTRDAELLYHEARELARSSDQLIADMPLDGSTLEALHRAVGEGSRVAASMVFTSSQALLASRAGASAVLVPVSALDAQGLHVGATLAEMRAIFDKHLIECEIVAVCPLTAAQVGACAQAGVDAVTVDVATLRDLLLHPFTDRTLDEMLPDILARGRHRIAV
jgi:transaldolase